MIHENYGVSVCNQVMHDTGESLDIRRVKTDRRLVQHIEDTRRAVSHGSRELHSLAFPSGECRCGAVQGEISQPKV